jgi:uncharacterized protein (TIGR03083 family)
MGDAQEAGDDWDRVIAARHEFTDLVTGLTPEQWTAPTLCDRWQPCHLVAHVIQTTAGSFKILLPHLVKSGLNPSKALGRAAISMGDDVPQAELLEQLRARIETRKAPPVVGPAGFIADVIVHEQDIRRPLGLPGAPDLHGVQRALEVSTGAPKAHGNQRRIADLHLVADDVDWSFGSGPEVTGTGEALLMAMWGRATAIEDLDGEGVATLRSRT